MPVPSRSKPHRSSPSPHHLRSAGLLVVSGLAFVVLPGGSPAQAGVTETADIAATLASAATARLGDRLERLRDPERVETSGVDLTLRLGAVEADTPADPWLGETPAPILPAAYQPGDFHGREAPERTLEIRRNARSTGPLDLWGVGSVDLGRQGDGMLSPARSTAGLSAGFDLQPAQDRSYGLSLGLDQAIVGEDGAVVLPSLSAYGSVHPTPHTFVDAVLGTALVERTAASTEPSADRLSGSPLGFGALTFGYEHRDGRWLVSPYGRVEASLAGGWGDPGTATARRSSAVAGLRTDYTVRSGGILLRPGVRFEVLRDLARVNGSGGPLAVSSAHRFSVAPSLRADITSDWSARIEHRADIGTPGALQSLELKINGKF